MNHSNRRRSPPKPKEPPILSGRVPPNDLGAEAAVLSACLLDAAAYDEAAEVIEGGDFYSDNHRLIWEALTALRLEGAALDVTTVAAWLRTRELIQRAGGAKYLGEIVDATPAVANVRAHAEIIKRRAKRRRVIKICQDIAGEGYGDIGTDDAGDSEAHEAWMGSAESRILDVTRREAKQDLTLLGDAVATEYRTLSDPPEEDVDCVPTGYEEWDAEQGGLYRGELTILGGRPGMGKSALATCVLRRTAAHGHPVALFSPEMPKRQVAQRSISQETEIALKKIRERGRRNAFTQDEWTRLTAAAAEFKQLPIHVDSTPGISALDIASKTRRLAARCESDPDSKPIGLVVIDYLQRTTWPGKRLDRDERVGMICKTYKNLAMELDVPVIALCQLNRGVETRAPKDRRPTLGDLRESGQIEQEADEVIFIYRDSYYLDSADPRMAEIIWSKKRMGGTGFLELGWWNWCTRFVEKHEAHDRDQPRMMELPA